MFVVTCVTTLSLFRNAGRSMVVYGLQSYMKIVLIVLMKIVLIVLRSFWFTFRIGEIDIKDQKPV